MVSWEFPPTIVGGLGRHVGALVSALRALGHEVRVIAPDAAPPLRTGSLLQQVADSQAQVIARGRRACRGWRPDVVHGHDWLTGPAATSLAASTGAPLVTTVHSTEAGRQQGYLTTPLQRAIDEHERTLVRASAGVLVCSEFMAGQVTGHFGVAAAVIGNGCAAPGSTNTAAHGERVPARIAFAGRLVHEKGLQELIKALPLLSEEFPDVHLVVAGSGPLAAAQRDRAERYRVADRISWHGFVDPDSVLARASVVVVPSLYEPFGLVALEAQAAGTPVAVADTGGLRELVADGVTGVLFRPEDPAAIAAAVTRLWRAPARATAMAGAAQRRAHAQFSWPAVAARVAAQYRRCTR
ncbi:MAG TPA: glycosyltransferase family 4 protein [Jatrophihabitans sp.]|nr:glycosyltransferase family 4 protein [Jatrophihabitans sp.]